MTGGKHRKTRHAESKESNETVDEYKRKQQNKGTADSESNKVTKHKETTVEDIDNTVEVWYKMAPREKVIKCTCSLNP